MTTEGWVTLAQVAEHLQVSQDTVHRWREQKGLPAHRVGRVWRFKLSGIDDWVRANGGSEAARRDQAKGKTP